MLRRSTTTLHPAPATSPSRPPGRVARSIVGGIAVATALAVATPAAAVPAADGENHGTRWPDGSYTVIVRGSGAGSLSSDGAHGDASATLSGQFTMTLDGGSVDGRADAHLLYVASGTGTGSGITQTGSVEIAMTGYAVAEGGRVAIHREQAVITVSLEGFAGPPQTRPLDDEFELIATSSSCGLVQGRMLGTFEGLQEAGLGFPSLEIDTTSDFLAVSDDLTGDADAWVTDTARIVDEVADLDRRMAVGELTVSEVLVALFPLVAEAESLTTGFTAAGCAPPDGFGVGLGSGLFFLLFAALDLAETPLDLGRIAGLAARAGLVDAEFSQALLEAVDLMYTDMVADAIEWDPGDLLQLSNAAGIAGDRELADELAEHYLEETE